MMKLPISADSYESGPAALIRSVQRASLMLNLTAVEAVEVRGASVCVDAEREGVLGANGAYEVVDEVRDAGVGSVIDAICSVYGEGALRCLEMLANGGRWRAETIAHAAGLGYGVERWEVLRLDGYRRVEGEGLEIQILPGRAVLAELGRFYESLAAGCWGYQEEKDIAGAVSLHMGYLDESRLELFVARIDRKIVGTGGVMTVGQAGVLTEFHLEAGAAEKGVGEALMRAMVDHCERALFDHVLVGVLEGSAGIDFYRGQGFGKMGHFERLIWGKGHV